MLGAFKNNLRKWLKVSQMQVGMQIAVPKAQVVAVHGGCLADDELLEPGQGDIMWDEIVEIKKVGQEKVYDIEVEGTHNFVAGNMIEGTASKAKTKSVAGRWFGGIFAHNTYISSRLGIAGDTTPDAILEIVSDGTNPAFMYSNSAGGDGDKFIITSAGNVGIGTITVDGPLDIVGLASSTGTPISIDGNDSLVKETSLQIYKEDVEDIGFGLETLMQLQPREFNWIEEKGGFHDFGFIAEEINAVNPLLAQYDHGNLQGVKYSKMTALLTKAIQEQQAQIEEMMNMLEVTTESSQDVFETEDMGAVGENGLIAGANELEMTTDLLSTLTNKIKATLEWLGMQLEDGIAYVKEIVTDKLTTKRIITTEIELIDKKTGKKYCTWIEDGEWVKMLGDCDSVYDDPEPEEGGETPPLQPEPEPDILETTTPSDEPLLEILDTTTPNE